MKPNPKNLLRKAKKLINQGSPAAAAEIYRQVLHHYPANKEAEAGLHKLSIILSASNEVSPTKSEVYEDQSSDLNAEIDESTAVTNVLKIIDRGEFELARTLAGDYLQKFPDSVSILNVLGALHAKVGEHVKALPLLELASKLAPQSIEILTNLGATQRALEDSFGAISTYKAALKIKPDDKTIHFNLANCLQEQGDYSAGEAAYRQVIKLDPNSFEAFNNLGLLLHLDSRPEEALLHFRKAIELNPAFIDAIHNLALLHFDSGSYKICIETADRLIELAPDFLNAFITKGNAFRELKEYQEAVSVLQSALKLEPENLRVLNNLCANLTAIERHEEALVIAETAVTLKESKGRFEPYHNLGAALQGLSRFGESISAYEKAIEINPNFSQGYYNVGIMRAELGEFESALQSYEKAIDITPDLSDAHANKLFVLNYHPGKTPEEVFAHYRQFDERFCLPYKKSWFKFDTLYPLERKIKVGYLSPDFRKHPVSKWVLPILEKHDRERFSIHAYAELALENEDEMTVKMKQHLDSWTSTHGVSDKELAKKIREDDIDILVDLAGHTEGSRVSMIGKYKPAPVVASYWIGFAYTTGLSAVDYFLAPKDLFAPDGDHLFSEQSLGLDAGLVYTSDPKMGDVNEAPVIGRGYITFGSLTRSIRINRKTVSVWSELLKRVDRSRLVLNSKSYLSDLVKSNIISMFEEEGVSRERLELGYDSPPWDVYRGIDIGLDCFPHNSGTTLAESLYLGIPFITLRGTLPVGRIGSMLLNAINRGEWIADTAEEYVNKAVALAEDINLLSSIRQSLRSEIQASQAMDAVNVTRELEEAYLAMCINS